MTAPPMPSAQKGMAVEVTIDIADLTHCPDAAKWAAAYKQTFPDADEELMLGWFANAMMAMHDWQAQNTLAATATAQAEVEALRERVADKAEIVAWLRALGATNSARGVGGALHFAIADAIQSGAYRRAALTATEQEAGDE